MSWQCPDCDAPPRASQIEPMADQFVESFRRQLEESQPELFAYGCGHPRYVWRSTCRNGHVHLDLVARCPRCVGLRPLDGGAL